MATVLRDSVGSLALIINGVEDHVHALVRLSRRFAVMKAVQKSKTETSKWLKRHCSAGDDFAWQAGYGAFSVSASLVEEVRKYIRNQPLHHQRMTFQDEFRELCRRHDLELRRTIRLGLGPSRWDSNRRKQKEWGKWGGLGNPGLRQGS